MSELTSEQHRRVESLFDGAVDLPVEQQESFLCESCPDDDVVRQRVRDLLRIDRSPTNAAIDPSGLRRVLDAATSANNAVPPPDRVGPYKLLQLIGSGGFGEVWLAERREPMVQRVALKIIKAGMDDPSFIARFEQERQALAVIDHPHVARVLDGGITESGRPFFVMEYVQGEPITLFADRHRLDLAARLDLFADVCDAIQHAHHKGIIHRDIKPANVMVAMFEGKPNVKVIDFGIAKSTKAAEVPATMHTTQAVFIGTPEYMSPEQAGIGAIDIDTRSDVYSLGVLLFELLSGVLPLRFDSKQRAARGYAYVQSVISDFEPAAPSKVMLTATDAQVDDIAKARGSTREALIQELRTELEWIPLKAIRKDRNRRYSSAESLARDVRRYIRGQPLEAAPESRVYLLRKFIARNRLQVFAASVLVATLMIGVVIAGLALQYTRAKNDELRVISEFQRDMLSQVDAKTVGLRLREDLLDRFGRTVDLQEWIPTAERDQRKREFAASLGNVNLADAANDLIDKTMLDPAATLIEERFSDPKQRRLAAALYQVLADQYQVRGFFERAAPLQIHALNLRLEELGVEDPETMRSMHNQSVLHMNMSKWDEAEALFKSTLAARRRILGDEHPDTFETLAALGVMYRMKGDYAAAEPLYRESFERTNSAFGEGHPRTRAAMSGMGALYQSLGDSAAAEEWFTRALQGLDEPGTQIRAESIGTLVNLGGALKSQDKYEEAERTLQSALELSRDVNGLAHPMTLGAMHELGDLRQRQLDFAGAERLFRDGLDAAIQADLGSDQGVFPLAFYNRLGGLADAQGKYAQAESYYRKSYEGRREVRGPSHPETLTSLYNLGCMLKQLKRIEEARDSFTEVLERNRSSRGDSIDTVDTLCRLAEVELLCGDMKAAESRLLEALQVSDSILGELDRRSIFQAETLRRFFGQCRSVTGDAAYDAKVSDCEQDLERRKRLQRALPER